MTRSEEVTHAVEDQTERRDEDGGEEIARVLIDERQHETDNNQRQHQCSDKPKCSTHCLHTDIDHTSSDAEIYTRVPCLMSF